MESICSYESGSVTTNPPRKVSTEVSSRDGVHHETTGDCEFKTISIQEEEVECSHIVTNATCQTVAILNGYHVASTVLLHQLGRDGEDVGNLIACCGQVGTWTSREVGCIQSIEVEVGNVRRVHLSTSV